MTLLLTHEPRARDSEAVAERVRVDGKQFAVGDHRFRFAGVTYGTFRPREDGSRFPAIQQVQSDFDGMVDAGFTVVRTYTPPPPDVVDAARERGLRLFAGAFYNDWRYLVGTSARERRRVEREAHAAVTAAAKRFAGDPTIMALSLGNEIPADVLRWEGTKRIARTIERLADSVREIDDELLVTYANFPTAEYLPLESLDFLTFNVFLERQSDFRRYLTRLQHLAGDRPLVLGEVGLDAGNTSEGEKHQASTIDWQLETALERGVAGSCLFSWTDEWWVGDAAVEGWHFGLTTATRQPRPALDVAASWNARSVRDLDVDWPRISVVICAYNAAATLDECLAHTCALDYPELEILVVDDGSTDATAEIARRYPRARLVPIEHAGLSVARNEGFRAATGDLVAYLDSDAYPTPEWPYYLALGMDGPTVGGVGGPNVPPPDDSRAAHQVARAPGGPVHVLVSDDRAEHIPGCNMAFWRGVLEEVGGCDPIYTSAGDDVDLCWKILDRGWDIGFHPAALVWHHRRGGLRPYLRQQRGYGRAEALVAARHPDRFNSAGAARWRGRIYDSFAARVRFQRIYRGIYGAAAYQSVYRGGGHALDILHQLGVPLAAMLVLTAPSAVMSPVFGLPALVAALFVLALGVIDVVRGDAPRRLQGSRLRFRCGVALLHLLQPLVRTWGRERHRALARRDLPPLAPLSGPIQRVSGGVLLLPESAPRAEVAAAVVADLRRSGLRVIAANGWEDYDVRILASTLVLGDVVTSSHPIGSIQLRVRRRPRWAAVSLLATAVALTLALSPLFAAALVAFAAVECVRGLWHTGSFARRVVERATASRKHPVAVAAP